MTLLGVDSPAATKRNGQPGVVGCRLILVPSRRVAPPLLALLIATALLMGTVGVATAEAEEAPVDATPLAPVTTIFTAPRTATYLTRLEPLVAEAAARLSTATERHRALVAEQGELTRRLTVADTRMTELQDLAAAAIARANETRSRLAVLTAAAYRDAGGSKQSAGNNGKVDSEREQILTEKVGGALDQLIARYQREQKAAQDARVAVQKEKDYLNRRGKELEVEVPAATAELGDATTYNDRVGRLINAWKSVQLGTDTPILGQPMLSGDELAAWYVSTKRKSNITVTIDDLADYFVEEGTAENVRGDIAFAQSILETASFGFPDYGQLRGTDNNYAGIGACDSCPNGYGFPDARTGVRAQIQHLRNYAQPGVTESMLAHPAVLPKFDQFGLKGRAPTWAGLTGTWASSTTYAPKIFTVYYGILEWVTDNLLLPQVKASPGAK